MTLDKINKLYIKLKKILCQETTIVVSVLDGSYARTLLNLEYPADAYSDLEIDIYTKDAPHITFKNHFLDYIEQKLGNEGQEIGFFTYDELGEMELAKVWAEYYKMYGEYAREVLEGRVAVENVEPSKLGLA
jgi:hypothetical protein